MSIRVALTHATHYRYDRAGVAGAARRAAAAGAALPDVDPQLFAAGQAGGALPQLAAGPVRQLPGAAGVPAAGARADASRSIWSPTCRPSTRSTSSSRSYAETLPVRVRAVAGRRAGAVPRAGGRRATRRPRWSTSCAPRPRARRAGATSTCWSTSTASYRSAPALRHPDGAGRVRARRDAGARARVVPRLRLAGGRGAAAARLRGALRVGLFDPARGRRRGARRSGGRQRGRRRSARLGRGLPARRRLGRAGRRPAACWPARGTSRSPARRCPRPRRRSPARIRRRATPPPSRIGEEFTFEMRVRRIEETPRVDAAVPRATSGRRSRRCGRQVDRDLERLDVRLTMGGEPTFVSIDDRDAPEWNTAALGSGQARGGGSAAAPAAHALRARRRASPRPGQVVPGRAAAALGVLLLLPPRRRADLARARLCSRRTCRRAPPTAPRPRRSSRRWRAGWASTRTTCCPPTRTSTTTCGASAGCRRTSTCWTTSSTTRPSGRGCARVFARRAGRGRRLRAAAARARVANGGGAGASSLGERRLVAARRASCSCCPGDSPMGFRLPLDSLPWEAKEARELGSTSAIRCSRARRSRASSPQAPRGGRSTARQRRRPRPPARRAEPRPIAPIRRRPHGAVRGGPRGDPARVPAAASGSRGVPGAGRAPSRTSPASATSRCASRATRRRPTTAWSSCR